MKLLLALSVFFVAVIKGLVKCDAVPGEVRVNITSGELCGARRLDAEGRQYASFRGVPYAKPPLGALRFAELQPADSWADCYNATVERDICPQTDILYKTMMQPRGMSEDCIHANIHVPIYALPEINNDTCNNNGSNSNSGLPIYLFVHGGAFQFGSGDTDVHGPERLVANDIITITFNYRINVLGFLSLNTTNIPGNNGLRDIITMLKWVNQNAAAFGGNPNNVTLAGQSGGAILVDLLTLSPAAKGLFNKAVILSGTSLASFYSTSPVYASTIATSFLQGLGINSTDSDEIHQQLIQMPIANISQVNSMLQEQQGLGAFFPVVESPLPGVQTIIPEDPFTMLSKGYSKDITVLIGHTDAECETFRNRFTEIDIIARISANPLAMAPVPVIYKFAQDVALNKSLEVERRYFNGSGTLNEFIKACNDYYFEYPALRVAKYRQQSGGASTFIYKYSYEAVHSPVKEALSLTFAGAGHIEDLTAIFKVNSVPVPVDITDEAMNTLMTGYIATFTKQSYSLEEDLWEPVNSTSLLSQSIRGPNDTSISTLTAEQTSLLEFFDGILEI